MPISSRIPRTAVAVPLALILFFAAFASGSAQAASGGMTPGGIAGEQTVPGAKAKLVRGKAIAPESAPAKVKAVIAAANRIRNKPYVYGGGHQSFRARGYDCSGAVSFALNGGRLIDSPLPSYDLAKWGQRGKGKWITVYGARSHAYMIVAGLRFDTSMTPGDGPGWSKTLRSTPERYKARHPKGL